MGDDQVTGWKPRAAQDIVAATAGFVLILLITLLYFSTVSTKFVLIVYHQSTNPIGHTHCIVVSYLDKWFKWLAVMVMIGLTTPKWRHFGLSVM